MADKKSFQDEGWDRAADINAVREMDFSRPGTRRLPIPGASGPPMPPPLGQSGNAPYTKLVYPPWIEKLAKSVDYRATDFSVALGANATIAPLTWQFRLPNGQVGFHQQLTFYILQPGVATSVRFTLRINNGPVPGYEAILSPPGIANFTLRTFNDMRISVPSGALVSVTAINLTANPETVGIDIAGWYHPQSAEERAWGSR